MIDAKEYKVKEMVTIEKFEVENDGRRLLETIKIEDGVVVLREQHASAQEGD
jgi:hypothetical protein